MNRKQRYSAALFDAFAAMDRAAMFRTASAHKDKARALLNEKPVVMTNRGYRIVDRWFRRVAFLAPRDLGKYIHGSTFEEPHIDLKDCIRTYSQGKLIRLTRPKYVIWKGIPEIKP